MYAVIRIGGKVSIPKKVNDTLEMMKLHKNNHCVIMEETPENEGMIKKCKDQVTWGEINSETLAKMILKRGRLPGNERVDSDYLEEKTGKEPNEFAEEILSGESSLNDAEIKSVFRLNPPSKGFKSTKRHYPDGSLGYRGEEINKLLSRMI